MGKYKKILVAFDGSKDGLKALDTAEELTKAYEAQLTVIYVHGPPNKQPVYIGANPGGEKFMMHQDTGPGMMTHNIPNLDQVIVEEEIPNKVMTTAKSKLSRIRGVKYENRTGKPAEAIVDFATSTNTDLIIIGHRGLSILKQFVIGSVSKRVIKDSDCAVFLVK